MTKHLAWVAVIVAVLGCAHAGLIAQEVPLERLTLPQGFRIDVYASGVENARQMTLSPSGTLFVGTRQAGNVYAVVDDNDDQRADRVLTIASGLQMPSGVAFRDGDLYVAEVSRIVRFDEIESRLQRAVFDLESSESAVTVMLWYQLVSWVGNVADCAEKVGNRLRLLIAS